MKKSIALLSVIVMLFGMAACGKEPAQTADSTSSAGSSAIDSISSTAEPEPVSSVTESAASAVSSVASSAPAKTSSTPAVSSKPAQSANKPTTSSKPSASSSAANTPNTGTKPSTGNTSSTANAKDPYVYPFDIEKIKQDLIEYGESLGLKYVPASTGRCFNADTGKWEEAGTPYTPDNTSWGPVSEYFKKGMDPIRIKKDLFDYVKFEHDNRDNDCFCIYTEPLDSGDGYGILFLSCGG